MISFADFEFLCILDFVCSSCICSSSFVKALQAWQHGAELDKYQPQLYPQVVLDAAVATFIAGLKCSFFKES